MFFRLPNGTTIPFTRVASVEFKTGYSAIQRLDSRRTVNINAMADRSIAEPEKIARELEGIFDEKYAERYPGIDFKLTGQSQDAQESLGTLATGLFLAMLVVSMPGDLSGLALYHAPFGLADEAEVRAWLPVDFAHMIVAWLAARLAIRR